MSAISTTTGIKDVPARGSRLIDADTNVTIFLKKLIVFGSPGSGVEVLSEGLKQLGLKVYDEAEAIKNYERDLPLWIEAAKLKEAGQPYDAYDIEKFLGKYDVIIGAPATYFAAELIKACFYSKFIVVTKPLDLAAAHKHRSFVKSAMLSAIDPKVFGKLYELDDLITEDTFDLEMVRSSIRQKCNLLELNSLDSWKPICDHIGMPIPDTPMPKPTVSTTTTAVTAQWNRIELKVGAYLLMLLQNASMAYCGLSAFGVFSRSFVGRRLNKLFLLSLTLVLLLIARFIMSRETDRVEKEPPITIATTTTIRATSTISVPPHLRKRLETASLGQSSTTSCASPPIITSNESSGASSNGSPPRQNQSRGQLYKNNEPSSASTNGSPPRQQQYRGRQDIETKNYNQYIRGGQNRKKNWGRNKKNDVQKTGGQQKHISPILNELKPVSPAVSPARSRQSSASSTRSQQKSASPIRSQQKPSAQNSNKDEGNAKSNRPARAVLSGAWGTFAQEIAADDRAISEWGVTNAENTKDQRPMFCENFKPRKTQEE